MIYAKMISCLDKYGSKIQIPVLATKVRKKEKFFRVPTAISSLVNKNGTITAIDGDIRRGKEAEESYYIYEGKTGSMPIHTLKNVSALEIAKTAFEKWFKIETLVNGGMTPNQAWKKVASIQEVKAVEEDEPIGKFPDIVAASGHGPYLENDFDEILQDKEGIECGALGDGVIDVLILGRKNWDKKALDKHIEHRRGKHLRVYSQEMFLAFIALESDPYENKELLEEFGEGHPALEYLKDSGFDWPTSIIVPGGDGEINTDWPNVGLLKHLKYTVGKKRLEENQRRIILQRVYKSEVPNVISDAYMAKWGRPNTTMRLKQLANEIASFASLQQKKSNPSEEAIEDWVTDLEWLKQEYYHGKYTFSWPSIYVRK